MPDENLFQTRAEVLNKGCAVSVTNRVLVLQVIPNKYGWYPKGGPDTREVELVPALPQKYYFHPCMWNGGLAIDATDNFSFAANDVRVGDLLAIDYVTDPQDNHWVNRIRIAQRPGGVVPPERRKKGVDIDGSTTAERREARLWRIHNAKMQ